MMREEPDYSCDQRVDHTPSTSSSAPSTVSRVDVDNLVNFVTIWTDSLAIEEVERNFKDSDFVDLQSFENHNVLTNVGFFYVKVDPNVPLLEFLGLLKKISWDLLKLSGTDQISYQSFVDLLGERNASIAIQLMVLGAHFQFWKLINPQEMHNSDEHIKLLLSGMGVLSVYLPKNFIETCGQLVDHVLNNE
jgi:hypothetical protein